MTVPEPASPHALAAVQTVAVSSSRALRDFLRVPYRIYEGDPNWVAPLLVDMKKMFDPEKHPFHRHSDVQPFLALRDGQPVGRIAAIHNRNHIAFHEEPVGFFGFFESPDDPEVAGALFDAAADWLRERGLRTMRGPTSFSTNEEAGLLVEGFDSPAMIMMPYNPPYYEGLIEGAGFRQPKTLLAYFMTTGAPERLLRVEDRLARRTNVRLRALRMEDFDEELARIHRIYTAAWERNWGFVPMTDEEFAYLAHDLKLAARRDPDLVVIAEAEDGAAVGFAVALRNYNAAVQAARGRLLPFGLLKILWSLRKIRLARVLILGLVPEYRGRGIDALMYVRLHRIAAEKGIEGGEFSWILEDNEAMRRPLERMGAQVYKRYRLYDRPL